MDTRVIKYKLLVEDQKEKSFVFDYQKFKLFRYSLLDWLLTVVDKLNMSDDIFFSTVELFDRFYNILSSVNLIKKGKKKEKFWKIIKYLEGLKEDSYQLVLICCLFLCEKFFANRSTSFSAKFFSEKLSHNKFSPDVIIGFDRRVIQVTGFLIRRCDFMKDVKSHLPLKTVSEKEEKFLILCYKLIAVHICHFSKLEQFFAKFLALLLNSKINEREIKYKEFNDFFCVFKTLLFKASKQTSVFNLISKPLIDDVNFNLLMEK
jgi:hypothetical protein